MNDTPNLNDGRSTEVRAADAFAEFFCDKLLFVVEDNEYAYYDDSRWVRNSNIRALGLAKQVAQELYLLAAECDDGNLRRAIAKMALDCEKHRVIKAMLELAKPRLEAHVDAFDRDPFLLNCRNGTLDLRTGELREHDRHDMISKLSPNNFERDAKCERWLRFLDEVFCGDKELIAFVHEAIGYTLTGSTKEQVVFLLYGLGENGKSKFLRILQTILGEYGMAAPSSTFMARERKSATNDIARLDGARFVSTVEPDAGQRLDESTVKLLTGGDVVSARFHYREFFDFEPRFKAWLACNHQPTIRGGDHGIWRRIRLLPFNARFTTKVDVLDELLPEVEGILAWAVEGCRAWQARGLSTPVAVKEATAQYRSAVDLFAQFLAAETRDDKASEVRAKDILDRYTAWAIANNERPLSSKMLATRLTERGYKGEHKRYGAVYYGLALEPVTDVTDKERLRETPYRERSIGDYPETASKPSHASPDADEDVFSLADWGRA